MSATVLLGLISLGCLLGGFGLMRRGWRQAGSERVLERLTGRSEATPEKKGWRVLERELLRAGIQASGGQFVLWLVLWLAALALAYLLGRWPAALTLLVVPPMLLRLYVAWRYRQRLGRMIAQLPQLLDHVIRSLKSGRPLGDAMLLAMGDCADPLQQSFLRTRRNIERGVPLGVALDEFAELYEREEFRILALGVRINQRYGGNAGELLDNLIVMIRDRDKAARQLRALTGETRISALVLGILPVSLAAYIFVSNPDFLLNLWSDPSGKAVLLVALLLQVVGSLLLWRMMRSIR